MHNITHKRKAVSPVIATVILIAVAVALGIAVAFWASGLTSSFSKYEKLGVSTQYATSVASGEWNISLGGQNTGSSDATIQQIQVNGVPATCGTTQMTWTSPSATSASGHQLPISVPSGGAFALAFLVGNGGCNLGGKTFASGQTVQVTIITAAGNNYPASIVLP